MTLDCIDTTRYPSVRAELTDFSRYASVFEKLSATTKLKSTDIVRTIRDFDVSTALPLILFLTLEAGLDEHGLRDCWAFFSRSLFGAR